MKKISEKAEPQYSEMICMNLFIWQGGKNWKVNKNRANGILGAFSVWNSGLHTLALIKYPC